MKRTALMWAALCAAHIGGAQAPFDLDTTFRSTITMKNVNSLLVMDDGKVVVSGRIYFPGDPSWDEKAGARLNLDGSRDLTFHTYAQMGGKLTRWNDRIYAQNGNGVRRLMLDGTLDNIFIPLNLGPYFSTGQGGDYHVYPDGRVLLAGWHSLQDTIRGFTGLHSLVWMSNTGYLDTTRTHRVGNNAIYTIKEQPDGKFLCSGLCTMYDGQPVGRVFRVEADGALDTTFQTDFVWGGAEAFSVLANGRIIVSGALLSDGASDTLQLVRLMPDGALDPSFNNTLDAPNELFGAFGTVGPHTILPDGRIVLHGNFHEADGVPRGGIALLDENGYLLNDHFSGPGCGSYLGGSHPIHASRGLVQDQVGNYFLFGTFVGYDDGTTNDPQQRFVSRLHGLNVGVEELDPDLLGSLTLQPNPASNWLACTYRITSAGGTPQLLIRDMTGRIVVQLTANGAEGQVVWDARSVTAGAYQVVLIDGNRVVAVQRAILQP